MNEKASTMMFDIQPKEKIWTKDFILICLANFFVFLGFQMTLPTLPLFVEYLGGDDQLIGMVVGIFTFSALIIRPFAGHALETIGRRFIYLLGLFIFVVSVGSYSFITSIYLLFIMRTIQGAGWGFSTTASGTIATDIIPASRRGEGLGYYGLAGNIAIALGPSLGLLLVDTISFYYLFLICGGLGLISLFLATKIKYNEIDKKSQSASVKWNFYEKNALKPSLLLLFITVTIGGIASFLPLYTAEKGIPGIQWYFFIYALALMISRPFSGQLYDKKGHRAIFIPGTILLLLSLVCLAWLPNSITLYVAAVLYGLGFGTVQPGLQAWAVEKSPKNKRGMANATFFSFFDLGIGIGAILFGQIAHWLNYSSIYIASAVSVFISMILYLVFVNKENKVEN